MILINLLPPELRKRQVGIDPAVISLVVTGVAALLLLSLWAYIRLDRIPAAKNELAAATKQVEDYKLKIKEIEDKKKKIAEIEKQSQVVMQLLANKQFWARTLDEFANMLSRDWNVPGFEASCTDISFGAAKSSGGAQRSRVGGGGGGPEVALFSFTAKFKLLGSRFDEGGDYIQAFFHHIENSQFWQRGGFQGKPEATYRSDSKNWIEDIKRLQIDMPLDFVRAKVIPSNWGK